MKRFLLLLTSLLVLQSPALARSAFEGGWTLQPDSSNLSFTSIKKGSVAETSHFDRLEGQIDPSGLVRLRVELESVDSGIDIRNVRLRFLFFETFTYPLAEIVAQVREEDIAGLSYGQSRHLVLPLLLTLHGITAEVDANVRVTLHSDQDVSIHTLQPVVVPVETFDLMQGFRKLEEAAEAKITPLALVTADFHFHRPAGATTTPVTAASAAPQTTATAAKPVAVAPSAAATPAPTAVERAANVQTGGCLGGLMQMVQSTKVSFADGGATLTPNARDALDQLAQALFGCPAAMLEIAGHTDTTGSATSNKRLSQRRAERVASYLAQKGIPEQRLAAVGYGEAFPLVPNTSDENRAQNRRITMRILN